MQRIRTKGASLTNTDNAALKKVETMEQWRSIDFFPQYEVSDRGNVRNRYTDRVLKQAKNPAGFYFVCLRADGTNHIRSVHRLVAEAFLPLGQKGDAPVHLDGDRSNNTPENLRWRSRRYIIRMGNQSRRTGPTDCRPVRDLLTGTRYKNALHAANTLAILEDDVVWAAQDPQARITSGRHFEFIY